MSTPPTPRPPPISTASPPPSISPALPNINYKLPIRCNTIGLVHVLTCILMCIAGFVNAIGYKLYSRSTGNMTGLSSTIISNAYGDTDHSLLGSQILQLLSYLFGGVMSGTLINSRSTIRFGTHLYGVALILCAVFTCVGWLIIRTDSDSSHGGAGQCFLCMALGLQNGLFSKHFKAVIRTTHVTGTVTDIGVLVGHMCARGLHHVYGKLSGDSESLTVKQEEERAAFVESERKQLLILTMLMVAFFLGNWFGFLSYTSHGQDSLALPVALYFAMGVWQLCYLKRKVDERTKRASVLDVVNFQAVSQGLEMVKEKLTPKNSPTKAPTSAVQDVPVLELGEKAEDDAIEEGWGGGGDEIPTGYDSPPAPPLKNWGSSFGEFPSTPPRRKKGDPHRRKTVI